MREIVHVQAGQCGNQIGAKVLIFLLFFGKMIHWKNIRSRDISTNLIDRIQSIYHI